MKIIFYAAFSLFILADISSCQKNNDMAGTKQITIDTTLASGIEYQLNLHSYGDADDVATIKKQATNSTVSNITNTAGTFAPVYHYSAETNVKTSVTDQVVLAVTEGTRNGRTGNMGNNNCRHSGDSTLITINFTVK